MDFDRLVDLLRERSHNRAKACESGRSDEEGVCGREGGREMVGGVEKGAGRDGNCDGGMGGVAAGSGREGSRELDSIGGVEEGSGRAGSRELDSIGGVPEPSGPEAANREMGTIDGVAEE